MNETKIELPASIKECLPCQQTVIANHLITLCNISKELNIELDCLGLAESMNNGLISTKDVIEKIATQSKGKSVEEVVDKIIHILDKKEKE